jgi:hypothetical protein
MKKGIRNIKLPNVLVEGDRKGKNHANNSWFDDWAECFKKINTTSL